MNRSPRRTAAIAALLTLLLAGCHKHSGPPELGSGFTDHFDRQTLGADWHNTGGPYQIENGALTFSMAHNHPLWLNRSLPANVQIDLDVTPMSPDGDVKVELMGDGVRFESAEDVKRDSIYTASGYRFIFGGWHNKLSTIAKQNEHTWQFDPSAPRRTDVRVVQGQRYHWRIIDRSGHITWWIDGLPFLTLDDPSPLQGQGHDRFGFDGWETGAKFENLEIKPL